jgi:tungstate transport system substrate-binding protein
MKKIAILRIMISLVLLASCTVDSSSVLRLATTTSTDNSGLLEAILPIFEVDNSVRVDVLAVGTGQALALGETGDVDVVLVHASDLEEKFIQAGHGTDRYQIMYNDFVIVGPLNDPAEINGLQFAIEAFALIKHTESLFASRGDESGTHVKELWLWGDAEIIPPETSSWYKSIGQGMGNTLLFAEEIGAYTLTDRATFIAMQENLPHLRIFVGGINLEENGDPTLINPYGLIPVNPDKGNVNGELAHRFAEWFTSKEIQALIVEYGVQEYGQPLFFPGSIYGK